MKQKHITKKSTTSYNGLLWTLCAMLLLVGCNKDMPNLLNEYSADIPADGGKTKVLFISVDGLRGKAVQAFEPQNIRRLRRNAVYTYGSLVDTAVNTLTAQTGWANLLTGVEPVKHKVTGADLSKGDFINYPTIFTRMKESAKEFTTAAFTASPELLPLVDDADQKRSFMHDDAATLAGALQEVSTGESDLIFVQFGEVEAAGQASSYEADDLIYQQAITAADAKIGQLVDALEARESYQNESWLVIVSSNKGGAIKSQEVDNTVYGDDSRNTFTLIYSPKFSARVLARPNSREIPFVGNAVRYTYGDNPVNAILDDATNFNFGADKDFTINVFIKSNIAGGNWNYPVFLAKRIQGFSGAGWNMFGEVRDGNMAWGFNSNIGGQVFGSAINDGLWHSATIVVSRSGDADSIKAFTDGVYNQGTTANGNSLDNDAVLSIGKWAGNANASPDFTIANLQVYNSAFSNKQVAELGGVTQVDESHAQYDALMGYWPGYADVGTNRLTEMSGKAADMRLTGPYNWMSFSDVVSHFRPLISYDYYRAVLNAVDIPFTIYKWIGVTTPSEWQLDGKTWTPKYIDIRD